MNIKTALLNEQNGKFRFKQITLDEPGADEVLVKVIATGVCHTDAVARELGLSPFPVVLGHEGSGIVEQTGENVTTLKKGDQVVISYASCGHCENCLTAHPSTCYNFNDLNFGGEMADGTHRLHDNGQKISTFFGQSSFATYSVANKRNVIKVDDEVDISLMGPLGCGILTGSGTVLSKLKPEFGSSIAIFGSGAVGLSAVMAAKITGCKQIIAVDIHENRLKLAKELGATHIFNSKQADVAEEIKKLTGPGLHYAVETTGVAEVVKQSVRALRPLGTCAIVGITGDVTFNVQDDIMAEGKQIVGVIEGDSVPQIMIPQLVDYYKNGLFPFDKLVGFYDFEDIDQAFEDSKTGKTIKPILRIAQN